LLVTGYWLLDTRRMAQGSRSKIRYFPF
jgi:hypothetical protein